MQGFFTAFDKTKPFFDMADKISLLLCKLFLVADILVTCYVVAGRGINRVFKFMPTAAWSEEIILSCMAYMAVLAAAIAIRKRAHIRMTAFDIYMPKKVVISLDILADLAVFAFGLIMLAVGWKYAVTIGAKGFFVSMPTVSRFWMYLPIPLAGLASIIFQFEVLMNDIKAFFSKEENAK